MTSVFGVVEAAFVAARDQWDGTNPMSSMLVVEALVDAGFCEDTMTGSESLEAGVVRAYDAMRLRFEGDWVWMSGDVADHILTELGLVTA